MPWSTRCVVAKNGSQGSGEPTREIAKRKSNEHERKQQQSDGDYGQPLRCAHIDNDLPSDHTDRQSAAYYVWHLRSLLRLGAIHGVGGSKRSPPLLRELGTVRIHLIAFGHCAQIPVFQDCLR